MEQLFKVEVRVFDETQKDSVRKVFYMRDSLSEAAILGWQKILEEQGGSMCWVKDDGTRARLGTFLPVGHPSHTYLVQHNKIKPEQHFYELSTKVVTVQEKYMFMTSINCEDGSKFFFPGEYYHGKN